MNELARNAKAEMQKFRSEHAAAHADALRKKDDQIRQLTAALRAVKSSSSSTVAAAKGDKTRPPRPEDDAAADSAAAAADDDDAPPPAAPRDDEPPPAERRLLRDGDADGDRGPRRAGAAPPSSPSSDSIVLLALPSEGSELPSEDGLLAPSYQRARSRMAYTRSLEIEAIRESVRPPSSS